MKAITAENLSAGYDKVKIISDISFHVRKGEILTLIGANGSGKSTILKTLSKHLKALGGRVIVQGRNVNDISDKELAEKIAVVLTERIHSELMTCEDIVRTGRYPYTGRFGLLSENDRIIAENALKMVEMENFRDSDFNEISDGQRQRILLARAVCQEPEILILDEPTSFLDIHHKIAFLEILRKLVREKNIAVVMSMHELDFAEKISDYSVCIKNGKAVFMGTPDKIFKEEIICELFDISEELYRKYR